MGAWGREPRLGPSHRPYWDGREHREASTVPAPRVTRVFGYWRAERRTIRQAMVALLLATAGNLIAGIALGRITGTLERLPGLLVLLPAAIATRGSVFGALGSRLGTSIHTGLFEVSRRREGLLYQNVYAATVLTVTVSVVLGVLAKLFSIGAGLRSVSVADLVAMSAVAGVLSSAAVGVLTIALAAAAARRAWDLDTVASPVVTAVGDTVTIPALFVATVVATRAWATPAIAATAAVAAVVLTVRGYMVDLDTARRTIRESLPVLIGGGMLALLAGVAIQARMEQFLAFPALLVLIPPLLADAGALGSVLSARLASKLHLGSLKPRAVPEALALLDTSIVLGTAVVMFALVGGAAHLVGVAVGLPSPGAARMVGVSLLAGMLATTVAVAVAYYAAVLTYRAGLDPDNHGVPVITSTMDLVGVVCLVLALVAFGLA